MRLKCKDCLPSGRCSYDSYDSKYDSRYCVFSNEWLDKKCESEGCSFCANRPKMREGDVKLNLEEIKEKNKDFIKAMEATQLSGKEIAQALKQISDSVHES